jgi:hypothetical protein
MNRNQAQTESIDSDERQVVDGNEGRALQDGRSTLVEGPPDERTQQTRQSMQGSRTYGSCGHPSEEWRRSHIRLL